MLGKNWALIGDAAAWVDPLTGEGLFYAMKSGHLLGKALAEGCPEKYPAWVKASVFGGTGIRGADRSTLLSRIVSGHGGDDADGAVYAAQPGISATDGRYFQRHAGLLEPEAPRVGPAWRHGERFRFERAEHRSACDTRRLRAAPPAPTNDRHDDRFPASSVHTDRKTRFRRVVHISVARHLVVSD